MPLATTVSRSHAKVVLHHNGLGILESLAHEIRSRFLLAQCLHIILQFLLEGGEKRVHLLPLF